MYLLFSDGDRRFFHCHVSFSVAPVHARSQSSRSGQSETTGLESRRGGCPAVQGKGPNLTHSNFGNQWQHQGRKNSEDLRFEILDFVLGTKLKEINKNWFHVRVVWKKKRIRSHKLTDWKRPKHEQILMTFVGARYPSPLQNQPGLKSRWWILRRIFADVFLEHYWEILHQLTVSLSHDLHSFIRRRWCRISSTNSMFS